MTSHQNMVEHRESCLLGKKEDLTVRGGEPHEMVTLELS